MSVYHVAKTGCDYGEGTKEAPFYTISKAAQVAIAGDHIIVHEGEYREWIKPAHSGRSNISRIVYEAAPGEKVVIKGSEQIQNWELVEGTVWQVTIQNSFFSDYNPYKEILGGDWFIFPEDNSLHAGEVYMNGKSFYEAKSLEDVKKGAVRTEGVHQPWLNHGGMLLYPEGSIYQWYTSGDVENTVIYANFHGKNPNEELTEISVRKCCFYPERTGRNYITVRGFEMAQAACPWTPPTADQPGLLGANWSKGWIIEDNIIHDAKCSGISIGKEYSTGHNQCTCSHRKPGYQYQMEAVFRARQIGWSKETIGAHIVRDNVIYNCGQNGIVGHMGCVFSEISHNEIYNIGIKYEFFGYEIGGIKLHAAIDVQILGNNIHHCALGTWLDWQAQGTRVSKNIYHHNNRDFMIEVTHGPYIVDNNIFASAYNLDNFAQGGAYLQNLFCGTMQQVNVLDRSTPYHFPHTTEVAGTTVVYGGDDRMYQNIFLGGSTPMREQLKFGTEAYNGFTETLEEYIEQVAIQGNGDLDQFQKIRQPIFIQGNAYLNGAKACDKEKAAYIGADDPQVKIIIDEDGATWLEMIVDSGLLQMDNKVYTTADLTMPRITEAAYETPEGNLITWNDDYLGNTRGEKPVTGPIDGLVEGFNRIRVW